MTLLGVTIPLALAWLIAALILAVIEALTLGLTTIWFAGGALAAVIAALLDAPVAAQVVIFVVVSLLLLVLTRPWALRHFKRGLEHTNIDAVVGREALVTGEIRPFETGEVRLNGLAWGARSRDNRETLPEGTPVRVVSVEGVKLIVVPKDKEE